MDERLFSLPEDKITAFCQRWKVTKFAIFGSALRQDFNARGDKEIMETAKSLPELLPLLDQIIPNQDE